MPETDSNLLMCYYCGISCISYNMMNQNVKPSLLFQFYFMAVPQRSLFTKTVFCCFDGFPCVIAVQYFT